MNELIAQDSWSISGVVRAGSREWPRRPCNRRSAGSGRRPVHRSMVHGAYGTLCRHDHLRREFKWPWSKSACGNGRGHIEVLSLLACRQAGAELSPEKSSKVDDLVSILGGIIQQLGVVPPVIPFARRPRSLRVDRSMVSREIPPSSQR